MNTNKQNKQLTNIFSCFVAGMVFFSAFLQNCFLCWNHLNGDVMPTLDMALLCSSREGSDLGCKDLV